MTGENVTIILTIVFFVLIFVYAIIINNLKRKKYTLNRIKTSYGKLPDREYSAADFESIPKYASRIQGDLFCIDDITWKDLDMDRVFMMINQTESACGEDYLYARLRLPKFDNAALEEDERLYRFFDEHQDERIKISYLLNQIGKMKDISVIEHIFRMDNIDRRPTLVFKLCGLFSLVSVVSLFIYPMVGIFLIVIAVLVAMHMHGKAMGDKMESYMHSLSGVLRMITAGKKITGIPCVQLDAYYKKIQDDVVALDRLRRKAKLIVSKRGYDNPMQGIVSGIISFFLLDIISFYESLDEYAKCKEQISDLVKQLGILDSSIAIASFRRYIPFYSLPVFDNAPIHMDVQDIYHPLIQSPVANSIYVKGGTLLTGSNASGKSTFVKALAINTILSQAIHTSLSNHYHADFLKVMTSMSLEDNIVDGESYFIVEIKSIKRILDEAKKGVPMLCIVDEVLRGTNTIERIAASSEILSTINKENVLMFAATHDIELTYILEKSFTNYHFDEEITNDDVIFNYVLKEGRAVSRNAIALLSVLGYPHTVIDGAKQKVKHFEETGQW